MHVAGSYAFTIHREIVAVEDNKGGQHGKMDEPLAAGNPVKAIASTNTQMTDIEARIISVFFMTLSSDSLWRAFKEGAHVGGGDLEEALAGFLGGPGDVGSDVGVIHLQ